MNMSSRCVLIYDMPYLQGCLPCICVINVVTSTSMQSSLRDIVVFRDLGFCKVISLLVIFMPCKHDATVRPMLVLSCFSKDNLDIWLCSIHPWPWLQLWSSLACHFRSTFASKCFLADCLHVMQFCQGCCS